MKRNTSLPWLAAVAMCVAVLTATPAAAGTVNDYPEDALKFAHVAAFRYAGDQPVDLLAEVVDIEGAPVEGATVTVDINTGRSAQALRVQLEDQGKGLYRACDAAFLEGATDIDVYEFTATMGRMHPAVEKVKSDRGNLCGAGEPLIHIASVQAAKLDGPGQPLSVVVELVDDGGNPVTGADVMVQVTDTRNQIESPLAEASGGRYADCSLATFDTEGAGQIGIMVYASAQGYRSASAWAENTVGYLCANPAQDDTTDADGAVADDGPATHDGTAADNYPGALGNPRARRTR
ncbi:MAG TPA: hypothetical protein VFR15_10790 [Chloroflexia bacterium]|nr:hypothetical protein [Chloroflexia bacterium]